MNGGAGSAQPSSDAGPFETQAQKRHGGQLVVNTDAERMRLLSDALRTALPEAELRGALLDVLRGIYEMVDGVPTAVERLVRLGLVQVGRVPKLRVRPRDPQGTKG